MHYLDEGSGDPVVMLHGNPTWSFFYRNLVKDLSADYRCIVPDHIGSGLSDKPSPDEYQYTVAQRAKDMESLLESLHITENITLVLHDWGGFVGMTYARKNKEKIKRIILLNTSAFRLPKDRPFPWMIGLCKNKNIGSMLVQGLNLFCKGSNKFCVKKPMSREVADMYLHPYDNWKNRYGVLAFILDVPLNASHVSYSDLVETECSLESFNDIPKLICWAEKDFVFDKPFLREWQKHFPDAELHLFSEAGHYILEDEYEKVRDTITNFLDKNPLRKH